MLDVVTSLVMMIPGSIDEGGSHKYLSHVTVQLNTPSHYTQSTINNTNIGLKQHYSNDFTQIDPDFITDF